jgi:hypothetical protein
MFLVNIDHSSRTRATPNPPGATGGIVSAATNSRTAGVLTLPASSTSTRVRTTLSFWVNESSPKDVVSGE